MNEAIDDGGDFRKARGFLVTFSTIVYLAWYFSINFNTFSIGGITLTPHDNAGDIWLAVAFINLYFWFRYIQNLPEKSLNLDRAMTQRLDQILFNMVHRFYRSVAFNDLKQFLKTKNIERNLKESAYRLSIMYQGEEIGPLSVGTISSSTQKRDIKRIQGVFTIKEDIPTPTSAANYYNTSVTPNRILVGACYVWNFISGGLSKPWVTDYILPLFYGYISIGISIWSWLILNKYVLLN